MLTAGLGPALWIATSESLVLNLNTAEADQLAALDASLAEWGGKIVAERDAHGSYGSLGDLTQRAGLPESLAARISGMAATAVSLGSYPRL
jgi:DNA uptake protein ComE-like DNA-binding protein